MKFLAKTMLLVLLGSCAYSQGARAPQSSGPEEHAFSLLRSRSVSPEFLRLLRETYRQEERTRVLDLNLLGFLRPRTEGPDPILSSELRRSEKFLREHRRSFLRAVQTFPVPKEVIAALLWVETKHGADLGTFHVASTYFSLLQAEYPTLLVEMMELARGRTQEFTPAIEVRIQERAKARSQWALGELVALDEIYRREAKDLRTLSGSFAGAFGIAQFIPSSYLSWAKSHGKDPDLFSESDAILSVANYLSQNGWKRQNREAQEAALFHYNRDRSYGERILRMAHCLRKGLGRQSGRNRVICPRSPATDRAL
jgi:membrane-bound lytic murein transglycosylase B